MVLEVAEYAEPLLRTPAMLRLAVDGMPDVWLDSRHAEDVVSPREAVAHMLLCEAEDSWITRIRRILEPSCEVAPGVYGGIADAELAATRPLDELLGEFETWRRRNLRELAELGLTADDLAAGISDDALGTRTVGHVLSTWVAHDLYHLGQVFKSYSALYVGRIGPYQTYLNLPHFN